MRARDLVARLAVFSFFFFWIIDAAETVLVLFQSIAAMSSSYLLASMTGHVSYAIYNVTLFFGDEARRLYVQSHQVVESFVRLWETERDMQTCVRLRIFELTHRRRE